MYKIYLYKIIIYSLYKIYLYYSLYIIDIYASYDGQNEDWMFLFIEKS